MAKVLFVGFGLNSKRTEAVSKNTNYIVEILSREHIRTHVENIGYYPNKNSEGLNGVINMVGCLINRKMILNRISEVISNEKITHVHDEFVFPGVSLLFTAKIIRMFPQVKFIKEVHNNPGYSISIDFENLLRVFLNRKSQLRGVAKCFDELITRNRKVGQGLGIKYISPWLKISPLQKPEYNKGRTRVCYLGHPLKKKGVYEFVKLFDLIKDSYKEKLIFNFAFSTLGNRNKIEKIFEEKGRENRLVAKFFRKVEPDRFFRRNDVLLLPLKDEYGSSGSLNTVLEAMEAGCLVVTTDTSMARGIIKHGVNGILLKRPIADEMLSVLSGVIDKNINVGNILKKARSDVEGLYSEEKIRKVILGLYG